MAKNYQIRWKRSDYTKLSNAVRNFNKKVKAAEIANDLNEFNNYLPELLTYKGVKANIQTRRELNRVLTQLKNINKPTALDIVYTKSGEAITQWERTETIRQAKIYENALKRQLQKEPITDGMGNERRAELIAQIGEIQDIENIRGYERKKLWSKIQKRGTFDYEFKMQVNFKENFLRTLKNDYMNEPYYKELMQKLSNMSPSEFYNFAYRNNLVDWLAADWYKLDRDKYAQLLRNADVVDIPDYIYGEYQD